MNHPPSSANQSGLIYMAILIALVFLSVSIAAQTPHPKTGAQSNVQQWKAKDQTYFRDHMPENGIFWSDAGTFSRDQRLQEQQADAKSCTVEGYGLSDFGVLPLATGAYLLTYKAEQYATCNAEKLPVHLNGSSIYIFKAGRWQAIYRAEVPFKNQR